MRHVRDIDLRALEPLPCRHDPPNAHQKHGYTIHDSRPVHNIRVQVCTCDTGETQNRYHEYDERRGNGANGDGEASKVPGAGAETVADEEDADENWCCEGTDCVSMTVSEK